ncbi:MAG: MXAN_2562 family outer membrane beta-barrel protein, partial [Pseudomonadota bacterium]
RDPRRDLPIVIAMIVLPHGIVSSSAAAQTFLEDSAAIEEDDDGRRSTGIVEVKAGPYYPSIDSEPGLVGKPYETTFGSGASTMVQLEIDRFLLWPYGQFGVALGLGYMSNKAQAFEQTANGEPDYDARASADETAFHLLPLAASLVYRFTWIADETVLPLVPYVKAGLDYGIWWATKGDGSLSRTARNGKARGGTLGWHGSLGLLFRADALDPGAARSMRTDWGVDHVGFLFEVTCADMSGLGTSNRLHVGDLFWTAGLSFEY